MDNHKNFGGNIMLTTKRAAGRLSLLAGSSMAAATLGVSAFTGLVLTPRAALAANECTPVGVDPSGNGATADSYTCTATTYATGITYSSNGALTVGKTITGATTVTANGVNLTGNGSDAVTWDSASGAMSFGVGTAGPGIDVVSGSGSITIVTNGVLATQAGSTHGIRATSTGGGNITISRTAGAVSNSVAGGQAAIEAVTNGGNISITNNVTPANTATLGRLRGILAQTSGAGTIAVSISNSTSASTIDGVAAIETRAGSGATTIGISGGTLNGGAGVAIRAISSSSTAVRVQNTGGTITGAVDFSGVTAGGVVFNSSSGLWRASSANVFSALSDTLTLAGGSGGFNSDNTLADGGSISFEGGADIFNVVSSFTSGASTVDFGSGADVLNVSGAFNANGTAVNFGADADALNLTGTLTMTGAAFDFGAGTDTFTQGGALLANGLATFANLEAFNNSGEIYFGNSFLAGLTDGAPNDRLRMSSGVFTGSGDSLMVMDATLSVHPSQIGCAAAVVADCADFTGAATAGETLVRVVDTSFDRNSGTFDTVVTLIDASSAAENFVLDPGSSYYAQTPLGAAIRKPVVAYYFQYDEANHRHILVSAPTDEPFQVGTFAASAQETWRATAGSWLTRQADLRATPGGLAASRGLWGRVGGQSGERDAAAAYSTNGVTLDYDLGQKQRIAHFSLGADLVGGPGWVIGAAVGFVRSDVEFNATPTEAALTGYSGGLYASYIAGPMFIDGVINANVLHVQADAPQMGLGLDVPMKFDLTSLGGQIEAGWRIAFGESLFVEPLAGVSYVVTRLEDTDVPGGSGLFDFDTSESLRFGGGVRAGRDSELFGMAVNYSLAGRYWNDTEGQADATITTASGSSAPLSDDFGGSFSEIDASLSLFSGDGGLSGFVNLGGKFGDDYESVDGALGVRLRW